MLWYMALKNLCYHYICLHKWVAILLKNITIAQYNNINKKKLQLAKRLMISKGEKLEFDPCPRNSNYLVTLLFNYPSFIIKMTLEKTQRSIFISFEICSHITLFFTNSFKTTFQKWKFDNRQLFGLI